MSVTSMNIEFDSYKQRLNEVKPALDGLADSLNLEGLKNELERLHAMQEAPGFWDNPERASRSWSRPGRPRRKFNITKRCVLPGTT